MPRKADARTSTAAAAPATSTEAPPAHRLNADAEVRSLADVAVALCEMAWLTDRTAAVQAELDAQVRQLKSDAEGRLGGEIDGHRFTFAERLTALRDAVLEYAEEHPDEICDGDKKTRQFTHGKVQLREQPASLDLRAGFGWDNVLEAAAADKRYRQDFVRIVEQLNKAALIKAARDGELETADLQALHVKLVKPYDQASVKLERYACIPPAVV